MQLCFSCSQTGTAAAESLKVLNEMFPRQAEWREEVKRHFEKIKSEGTCLHRLDEELINRRREELRSCYFFFSINFSEYSSVTQPFYSVAHKCEGLSTAVML